MQLSQLSWLVALPLRLGSFSSLLLFFSPSSLLGGARRAWICCTCTHRQSGLSGAARTLTQRPSPRARRGDNNPGPSGRGGGGGGTEPAPPAPCPAGPLRGPGELPPSLRLLPCKATGLRGGGVPSPSCSPTASPVRPPPPRPGPHLHQPPGGVQVVDDRLGLHLLPHSSSPGAAPRAPPGERERGGDVRRPLSGGSASRRRGGGAARRGRAGGGAYPTGRCGLRVVLLLLQPCPGAAAGSPTPAAIAAQGVGG